MGGSEGEGESKNGRLWGEGSARLPERRESDDVRGGGPGQVCQRVMRLAC